MLLYKAEIQDRKHEILTSEEEYLKVLNIVDEVLSHVEEQLKQQNEGITTIPILIYTYNRQLKKHIEPIDESNLHPIFSKLSQ